MRYDLYNFAYLWKRGKMGCFERLISAVCWWLTAHFCNNMSKNAFCFVFWAGGVLPRPAPLQFQWKSFSDYPTPFFIAGFSFWFRQKNKRTCLSLAGTLMKLMYLCLVSFLLWPLAIGYWPLVVWKTGSWIAAGFQTRGRRVGSTIGPSAKTGTWIPRDF